MKKFIIELLFMDREKISHTKFWSNVGMGVVTTIIICHAFRVVMDRTEDGLNMELLWFYAAVVIVPKIASTFLKTKYGGNENVTKSEKLGS